MNYGITGTIRVMPSGQPTMSALIVNLLRHKRSRTHLKGYVLQTAGLT